VLLFHVLPVALNIVSLCAGSVYTQPEVFRLVYRSAGSAGHMTWWHFAESHLFHLFNSQFPSYSGTVIFLVPLLIKIFDIFTERKNPTFM